MKLSIDHPRVQAALEYAKEKHKTQKDAAGNPYFPHLFAVTVRTIEKLNELPEGIFTEEEMIEIAEAAALHDIVEDFEFTGVDIDMLRAQGFSERVLLIVARLTGRPGDMTYQENIECMAESGNLKVMIVKLADNEHNMLPERIAQLPPKRRSISERYKRSSETLRAGIKKVLDSRAA